MKYRSGYLFELYNYESPYFTGKYLKGCLVENYEIIGSEIEVESDKLKVVIKIGNTYYELIEDINHCKMLLSHIPLKERVKTINEAFIEEIIS